MCFRRYAELSAMPASDLHLIQVKHHSVIHPEPIVRASLLYLFSLIYALFPSGQAPW